MATQEFIRGPVAAVILTGGSSVRMGRPKALLELGQSVFLERIATTIRNAGIADLSIIAGEHADAIMAALPQLASLVLRNPAPELGQLHSLRLGIRSVPVDCSGLLMALVDHPLVTVETVSALVGAFRNGAGEIVIPVHAGRRGHPVLFGRTVFPELLAGPLEGGARRIVRARAERVVEIEVPDPHIHDDIDTPEDYRRILAHGSR